MPYIQFSIAGATDNPSYTSFGFFIGNDNFTTTELITANSHSGGQYPKFYSSTPNDNNETEYFTINTSGGNNYINYYTGSGYTYVTFRNTSPNGQHPSSGFSFDIWQPENVGSGNNKLADDLFGDLLSTGGAQYGDYDTPREYDLATDKYTLLYDYGNAYSPNDLFFKGGTLTVSYSATFPFA